MNTQEDSFSPITDYPFKSKCATVSLYAGTETDVVANVVMGAPGSNPGTPANWWHVMTINVDEVSVILICVVYVCVCMYTFMYIHIYIYVCVCVLMICI